MVENMKKNHIVKKAVLYLRFSSHKQNEQSIEGQRSACVAFCKQKGIKITGEYIDRAISASKGQKREAFERMVMDSSNNKFDYVVVYKLDRFSRDRYESAVNRKKLRDNGVRVLSAMENVDDTPESILLESVLEGLNEYYSKELGQKVLRGMSENFKKGYYSGGRAPLGLKVVDKRLVPDEEKAPIVQDIFQWVHDGYTFDEIREFLMSKYNHSITRNGIHTLLKNRRYIGFLKFGDEERKVIEPIISEDLFYSVKRNVRGKRSDFFLTGKLFCGDCGSAIVGTSGQSHTGTKYDYYICVNRKVKNCPLPYIKKDVIEGFVLSRINHFLLSEELEDIIEQIYESFHQDYTPQKKRLAANIRETKNKINNITAQIADGAPWKVFKDKLDELQAQLEEYESQNTMLDYRESVLVTKEQIREFLLKYVSDQYSTPYKKLIFRELVNKVEIWQVDEETALVEITINSGVDGSIKSTKTGSIPIQAPKSSDNVTVRSPLCVYQNLIILRGTLIL